MIGNFTNGNSQIGSNPPTPATIVKLTVGKLSLIPARPVVLPSVGLLTLTGLPLEVHTPEDIVKGRGRLVTTPVFIVDITLKNSGEVLRFSDRPVDYLGVDYQTYINKITGLRDLTSFFNSMSLNSKVEIAFRNETYKDFDYLIEAGDLTPFEGAEVTIREFYILPDGNHTIADIVFRGVLEEPRDIDRLSFKCYGSSLEYYRAGLTKPARVTIEDYPDAYEDLGDPITNVIGSSVLLPTKRIDWGARTTLVSALTKTSLSAILTNGFRFPNSGSFRVNNEKISYTGKSGNTLTGLTRGVSGTTATVHAENATVWENQTYIDSVIADHPIKEVEEVFAEIKGELFRVTGGVSNFTENGRQILRSDSQVSVNSQKEDVAVANPTHRHPVIQSISQFSTNLPLIDTGCAESGFDSINIQFPSTSDKNNANYDIDYDLDVAGDCLGTVPKDMEVSIGGIIIYKRDSDVTSINLPPPLKFSQPTPTDQVLVVASHQNFGFGNAGVTIQILSAARIVSLGGATDYEAQDSARIGDVVETYTVDRFHVRIKGVEDTGGIYAGAGTVVDKPDHVLRWLLTEKLGFMPGDIDIISFNAAGASYDAAIPGGYKLAFTQDLTRDPNLVIREIAAQVRSILKFTGGLWKLDYLPDVAPAALRTIDEGDIAGKGSQFIFSRGSIRDIANLLNVAYDRNSSPLRGDSIWDKTYTVSDAASIAKFGQYKKDIALWAIKDQATAEDVIDFKLSQLRDPGLIVKFALFFEYFDLVQGDTIEIISTLFGGDEWIIEKWTRSSDAAGKLKFNIEARKWPS